MAKKPQKLTITWDDESLARIDQIAREYERSLLLNRVHPTTRKSPTAEERPNASGIIRFALMVLTGEVDGVSVEQDV